MKILSHDGVARQTLVREVSGNYGFCDWCGSHRYSGPPHRGNERGLFRYGTNADDSGYTNWHEGYFCSKSCHNSYCD